MSEGKTKLDQAIEDIKAGRHLKKKEPPPKHPVEPEQRREIFVRKFVTRLLANEFNASQAYRDVRGDKAGARVMGHRELQQPDVRAELHRQLGELLERLDLDEQWVYRQWKSMAESNIFDYVEIDENGMPTKWKLDPENLTWEQQLNIREIKFSPKTGHVTGIKLAGREDTVANVARARKMFIETQDKTNDLERFVTELMQRASKRYRTFDHDTGEEIDE